MRKMIINVRGTNGSGKSTVIFHLIKKFGATPLRQIFVTPGGKEIVKIWAYRLHCNPPLYVVGRYETPTGGCDALPGSDFVTECIRKLAPRGDVIFEGLIATGIYGRWVALAKELKTHRFIFAVLDTPLKKCIKRVVSRRAKRGQHDQLDPTNLLLKHRAVVSSKKALTRDGMDVRDLPYKHAVSTILKWKPREKLGIRFPR